MAEIAVILGVILFLIIVIIIIVVIFIIGPANEAQTIVDDNSPIITQTIDDVQDLLSMFDGLDSEAVQEFFSTYFTRFCAFNIDNCSGNTPNLDLCPPLCNLMFNIENTCEQNPDDAICQSLGLPILTLNDSEAI